MEAKSTGNVFLLAVRQEAVHPGSLRCGRSANAQPRTHALDGARGAVVELVVRGFFRIAHPEINVRLVPDFEVPLRDFVFPVAGNEVTRKVFDQLLPLVPLLGRSDILLVPKGMKRVGVGGKLLGHEAQLDERPNMVLQQAIVDLVHVRKVVDGLAIFVFVIKPDFVMENRVKSHVLKPRDALGFAQVVAVVFAKAQDGAPRTKHLFPKMWKRMRRSVGINFDGFSESLRLSVAGNQEKTKKAQSAGRRIVVSIRALSPNRVYSRHAGQRPGFCVSLLAAPAILSRVAASILSTYLGAGLKPGLHMTKYAAVCSNAQTVSSRTPRFLRGEGSAFSSARNHAPVISRSGHFATTEGLSRHPREAHAGILPLSPLKPLRGLTRLAVFVSISTQ